jgi:hypothetical protein
MAGFSTLSEEARKEQKEMEEYTKTLEFVLTRMSFEAVSPSIEKDALKAAIKKLVQDKRTPETLVGALKYYAADKLHLNL